MSRSFRAGVLVGLVAPVMFLAAFAMWVHHFTGQIPFPVRSANYADVTIRLLPPDQVPSHWQEWRASFEPAVARIRASFRAIADRSPR